MKSEITVSHVHIETDLVLSDEAVQILVVENADEFYNIVSELYNQFDGEDGNFVFKLKDEVVSAEKNGIMICNPFHLDYNDKKIISLLYKVLEKESLGDALPQYNEVVSSMIKYLEEISFNVPFKLSYNEPQPAEIMKVCGLKIESAYDTLLEKIICFINALIELKKCEFFVFVNLKSVLSDEKLLNLYSHCKNEKVGLLLIESSIIRNLLPEEKAVVITEDLCEILVNYN